MTYTQRAIYVGGYFTLGMLIINILFAGVSLTTAIIMSLVMGGLFTGISLAVGLYPKKRRY